MKGKGIVQRILNILEGIPFGKLFFQVAKILRSSLLLSSLLCNSETRFRVSKPELELLESVVCRFNVIEKNTGGSKINTKRNDIPGAGYNSSYGYDKTKKAEFFTLYSESRK